MQLKKYIDTHTNNLTTISQSLNTYNDQDDHKTYTKLDQWLREFGEKHTDGMNSINPRYGKREYI